MIRIFLPVLEKHSKNNKTRQSILRSVFPTRAEQVALNRPGPDLTALPYISSGSPKQSSYSMLPPGHEGHVADIYTDTVLSCVMCMLCWPRITAHMIHFVFKTFNKDSDYGKFKVSSTNICGTKNVLNN